MKHVLILLLLSLFLVNGKPKQKIKTFCFIYEETMICPGCPENTGLLCESLLPRNEWLPKLETTTETVAETTSSSDNETISDLGTDIPTSVENDTSVENVTSVNVIDDGYTTTTENPDFCEDNRGCDCPLICCYQGKDKPKKCVHGVRLPPPWGRK